MGKKRQHRYPSRWLPCRVLLVLLMSVGSPIRRGRTEILRICGILVAFVAMAGCPFIGGGLWKPEVGIYQNDAGVRKTVLGELTHRVYDLEWAKASAVARDRGPGPMIAVTGVGAFWFDGNGELLRQMSFDLEEAALFKTRTVVWEETGSRFYAGLLWGDKATPHLVVLDEGGEVLGRIPEVSSEFALAVLGDRRVQVVVERSSGKEVGIFEVSGRRVESFVFPFYVTDLATADFDGDGVGELLVYLYPNRDRGGTFRLLDGRSSAKTWSAPSFSAFAVLSEGEGRPRLVYPVENGFGAAGLAESPTLFGGCTDAHRFSQILVATADQYMMVVVSGGGYLSAHMLCLYDSEGALIYREVAEERAYDLLAYSRGEEIGFLTNEGARIVKYEISAGR